MSSWNSFCWSGLTGEIYNPSFISFCPNFLSLSVLSAAELTTAVHINRTYKWTSFRNWFNHGPFCRYNTRIVKHMIQSRTSLMKTQLWTEESTLSLTRPVSSVWAVSVERAVPREPNQWKDLTQGLGARCKRIHPVTNHQCKSRQWKLWNIEVTVK